jgi:hypothetical protein
MDDVKNWAVDKDVTGRDIVNVYNKVTGESFKLMGVDMDVNSIEDIPEITPRQERIVSVLDGTILPTIQYNTIRKVNHGNRIEIYTGRRLNNEQFPSIVWDDGSIEWYMGGRLYKQNGPAVEKYYVNGSKECIYYTSQAYKKPSRADGPAKEYYDEDGTLNENCSEYWLNGKKVSKKVIDEQIEIAKMWNKVA